MTITTNPTAPVRAMSDRDILARRNLSNAIRLESTVASHPHTQSMCLDVLQVAALEGWSEALHHLRRATSSHMPVTAQTAARLLAQFQASVSETTTSSWRSQDDTDASLWQ